MSSYTAGHNTVMPGNSTRFRRSRWRPLLAATLAALMTALGTTSPAFAQAKPPGDYFEIDFTAAAPLSYNHLTGGGAYDTGQSNIDTVQSLEGRDFGCGDIVSFMTKITMKDGESVQYGNTTVRLRYSFDMASTGSRTGVAFADLVRARINYAPIEDLLESDTTDSAINDDANSVASIYSETPTGALWVSGSELITQIDVTNIKAGETVVLHLDVKIKCDPQQTSSGNIQAQLDESQVIAVENNPNDAVLSTINSGERTIPMKAGSILYPQVSIQKTVTTPTGTCATATDSILIDSGDQVKYCFTITNPSNVLAPPGKPLYQVRVKDDNGTPGAGNEADDFWLDAATISGLTDEDGFGQLNDLAPGATATAEVIKTISGEPGATIINTATAYGDDSVIDPYTLEDSDNAQVNLSAAAPAVAIAKTTSNEVDSTPSDSPLMYVGETARRCFRRSQTGTARTGTRISTRLNTTE